MLFKNLIIVRKHTKNYTLSLDLSLLAKTRGFLPEEVALDKHLGLRFGATVYLFE